MHIEHFTPLPALLGGALIGLAATLFLGTHGRIAGISGIFGGVFLPGFSDRPLRLLFVLGLLAGGGLLVAFRPEVFSTVGTPSLPILAVAGLVVGFGTRLGNGCTSGHGVCGIGRLSTRSLVATGVFMATGFLTVFLTRHAIAPSAEGTRGSEPVRIETKDGK